MSFVDADTWSSIDKGQNVLLPEGEPILGAYLNSLNPFCALIFYDEKFAFINGDDLKIIWYSSILGIKCVDEKVSARTLSLDIGQKQDIVISVLGGDKKFRDVFPMMRFLMRASEKYKNLEA